MAGDKLVDVAPLIQRERVTASDAAKAADAAEAARSPNRRQRCASGGTVRARPGQPYSTGWRRGESRGLPGRPVAAQEPRPDRQDRGIIDRAAAITGKTRTDIILDATRRDPSRRAGGAFGPDPVRAQPRAPRRSFRARAGLNGVAALDGGAKTYQNATFRVALSHRQTRITTRRGARRRTVADGARDRGVIQRETGSLSAGWSQIDARRLPSRRRGAANGCHSTSPDRPPGRRPAARMLPETAKSSPRRSPVTFRNLLKKIENLV